VYNGRSVTTRSPTSKTVTTFPSSTSTVICIVSLANAYGIQACLRDTATVRRLQETAVHRDARDQLFRFRSLISEGKIVEAPHVEETKGHARSPKVGKVAQRSFSSVTTTANVTQNRRMRRPRAPLVLRLPTLVPWI
jgi:hypothetical protein